MGKCVPYSLFALLFLTAACFGRRNGEFTEYPTKQFVIKARESDVSEMIEELKAQNVTFLRKINVSSGYYVFEAARTGDGISRFLLENNRLKNKIIQFERIRAYSAEIIPEPVRAAAVSYAETTDHYYKNCPTYSEMGVKAAWSMGYTGKGLVIAITDVGINTEYQISSQMYHGNNWAGIIGAAKNDNCGDGIVFEVDLVDWSSCSLQNMKFLFVSICPRYEKQCRCGDVIVDAVKMFKVTENPRYEECRIDFETLWLAEGLVHAIDTIDIYSNSWGSATDFIDKSVLVSDALRSGTTKGRGGKGAIYVFPINNLADPYANNIHTIAVNSVGGRGHVSSFAAVCACTLTSAYGEPSETENMALYTTSNYQSNCTIDFKGTSAATAIVSGIIGLALQTNPALMWRDVQDLIVHSSEAETSCDYSRFVNNGAGKRYHPIYGFGLLNATKLVHLAKTKSQLPAQLRMTNRCTTIERRRHTHRFDEAEVEIKCSKKCINRTESVIITLSYETPDEYHAEILFTSPYGTTSTLMDQAQSSINSNVFRRNVVFKSVNFWGENAEGRWILTMKQHGASSDFKLLSCEIQVYGTGHVISSNMDTDEQSGTFTKVQETTTKHTQATPEHYSQELPPAEFSYTGIIFILLIVGPVVLINCIVCIFCLCRYETRKMSKPRSISPLPPLSDTSSKLNMNPNPSTSNQPDVAK